MVNQVDFIKKLLILEKPRIDEDEIESKLKSDTLTKAQKSNLRKSKLGQVNAKLVHKFLEDHQKIYTHMK